ncbi:methylated-DNA--protein-cysteine methyltransferase [Verrucomicrobiota bacterium]|nr:methylated-DNA--protein-cysteine methyltransferase [Verrucomicrobiota bacterium]
MNQEPETRRATEQTSPLRRALIATEDGCFTAEFSAHGLARLSFPATPGIRVPKSAVSEDLSAPPPPAWLKQTCAAVDDVLAGRAPRVFPPLDLSCGTPFQQFVWQALSKIPVGETRSYGEIARDIGRPRAVRAVGAACGANPVPLLVPCHRVLAANGKLGGFSGGPEWKPRLLRREGSWGEA